MSKGSTSTFSVQAFRQKGKGLEAEPAQQASDEAHALRKVERLAAGKAGAVAVRHDGASNGGDFDEPIVLKIVGRVPPNYTEIPF